MRIKMLLPALCCGIAFFIVMQCANPGSGTETGNPVVAMLYNPDGSPAASAKVCFYRHHDDPRNNHAVDSTTTDNNGNYSKKLDTGTYNILATLDTNATFQDSIVVIEHDTTRPPPDTLKSLGSISGRIELQGTDDPRTVFILFMGSNTFTRPTDLLGNFTAANMAKGKYPVTLLTTLDDYDVMDTSFMITAGRDSVIPQPIVLQYTGIPIPQGLRIVYDTLKQIVTLYWNTPTTGRPVQSYTVYRKHSDSASFVSIKYGVTDTSYNDSTGVQDMTYEYRVAVVDTNASEGTKSAGVSVIILGAYSLVFSAGYGTGTGNGYFNNLSAITSGINGKIYCADAYNYRIQVFDSSGVYLSSWGRRGTGQGEFGDRIADLEADSLGNIYVVDNGNSRIQKFDADSNFISEWTTPDTGWQGFSKIAIHNDSLFVGSNYGIRIFNLQGQYIATIPEIDGRPNPYGIAPTDSFVYVAQSFSSAEIILRYSYGGLFIDTLLSRTAADTSLGGGRIDDLCYSRSYDQLIYLDRTDERIRGIGLDGIEAWHFAPHYSFTQESYHYSMSLLQDNSILIGYTDGRFQKYSPGTVMQK